MVFSTVVAYNKYKSKALYDLLTQFGNKPLRPKQIA